jgi:hypothetical protein
MARLSHSLGTLKRVNFHYSHTHRLYKNTVLFTHWNYNIIFIAIAADAVRSQSGSLCFYFETRGWAAGDAKS